VGWTGLRRLGVAGWIKFAGHGRPVAPSAEVILRDHVPDPDLNRCLLL
jgi:hypothetical protein